MTRDELCLLVQRHALLGLAEGHDARRIAETLTKRLHKKVTWLSSGVTPETVDERRLTGGMTYTWRVDGLLFTLDLHAYTTATDKALAS